MHQILDEMSPLSGALMAQKTSSIHIECDQIIQLCDKRVLKFFSTTDLNLVKKTETTTDSCMKDKCTRSHQ